MTGKIAEIRKEYLKAEIDVPTLAEDPIQQFRTWLSEAIISQVNEPTAFCLSTVSDNKPHSRIVLLKEVKDEGFVFFTNYQSNKGKDMAENPNVALNFFWPELERQVRIEGAVQKVSEQESDQYFKSRPLGSQIGAWASPQSTEIADRSVLEERVKKLEEEFKEDLQRPPHWGGFCVSPSRIEFWQGRASRLHDRIVYKKEHNLWIKARLAP